MHFSLATIALVGLGNVLFSVNGAPTDLSQRGSSLNAPDGLSKRVPVIPKVPHPADPEPIVPTHPTDPEAPRPGVPAPINPSAPHLGDPGSSGGTREEDLDDDTATTYTPNQQVPAFGAAKPYTKELVPFTDRLAKNIKPEDWPHLYVVKSKNFEQGITPLDKIGVNKDKKGLSIFDAQNKYDLEDQPNHPEKLRLNQIMGRVFVDDGNAVGDLKWIHCEQVQNKLSDPVFEEIFESLGKDPRKDTVTFSSTDTDDMKTYFEQISNTPFPKAAARYNGEFSTGNTIKQYKLSPYENEESPDDVQNLDIYMG